VTGKAGLKQYPFTIAWIFLYLLCLVLSQVPEFPSTFGYFVIVLAIGIPLTVLMCREWSVHIPNRKITLFLFLSTLAWWVATMMLARMDFEWRWFHALNSVVLLIATFGIGFWLAGELEKSGHLLPVAILGALVDVWSVFLGPSKAVGEKVVDHIDSVPEMVSTGTWIPPPVVSFLLVHFPQPGADFMAPTFGFGDWVFIGMFLAGSNKFGIPVTKTVWLVLLGMALSLAISYGFNAPVPALPFICGSFLAGNFRQLKMTSKEWKMTWVIVAGITIFAMINLLKNILL